MDVYILRGKIYKILPESRKSDKFTKQEFVLQTKNTTSSGTYIDYVRLQCINEKLSLIEDAEKGDIIVVKFNIRGNKVGKKDDEIFFTNLDVVDLSIVSKQADEQSISENKNHDAMYPSTPSESFPGFEEESSDDDEPPWEPKSMRPEISETTEGAEDLDEIFNSPRKSDTQSSAETDDTDNKLLF